MNLTISGHHLDVSPALREYVLTKMDRITRHFDQVVDINVLLSVEKLSEKERRQKAEVTLHVKGKDIFVEHASEDLYAAIDQLVRTAARFRPLDPLPDKRHFVVPGCLVAFGDDGVVQRSHDLLVHRAKVYGKGHLARNGIHDISGRDHATYVINGASGGVIDIR